MSESPDEQAPLLGRSTRDGKSRSENLHDVHCTSPVFFYTQYRANVGKHNRRTVILCTIAIVCIIVVMVVGTAPIAVPMVKFFGYTDECQNATSSFGAQSRSGSYSLVDVITDSRLVCFEPLIQVALISNADSSVEIYQTLCENVEERPFEVAFNYQSETVSGPKTVFDQNYGQNYFMDGSIRVDIIDAATNLSSVDMKVCLFARKSDYQAFLSAGVSQNNHTETAGCRLVAVTNGGAKSYTIVFSISKPSFVFVAIASTGLLHIDQLKVNATGHNISGLRWNPTNMCPELGNEDITCTFNLSYGLGNESICIVAHENSNQEGIYDYSNITVNLPNRIKHDNPCKEGLEIYGYTILVVDIVLMTVIVVLIFLMGKAIKRLCSREMIPIEESVQQESCTIGEQDN